MNLFDNIRNLMECTQSKILRGGEMGQKFNEKNLKNEYQACEI